MVKFHDSTACVKFIHCVVSVVTGPITGADFLKRFSMEVNFADSLLRFGEVSYPISMLSARMCDVVLAHDVVFKDGQQEDLNLNLTNSKNLIHNGQPACSSAHSFSYLRKSFSGYWCYTSICFS